MMQDRSRCGLLVPAVLLLACAGCVSPLPWSAVTVHQERPLCVLADRQNVDAGRAADELALHLEALTGRLVLRAVPTDAMAVPFLFHVGRALPNSDTPLAAGHGRYSVTPNQVVFSGAAAPATAACPGAAACTPGAGLQRAVHEFLARECGVRWVMPGRAGTSVTPRQVLVLRAGEHECAPASRVCCARQPAWDWRHVSEALKVVPPDFQVTAEQCGRRREELVAWASRHGQILCDSACSGSERTASCGDPAGLLAGSIGLPSGRENHLYAACRGLARSGKCSPVCTAPRSVWLHDALAAYISVRCSQATNVPFRRIVGDFCASFGAAAEDVDAYFEHWRRVYAEKIAPAHDTILRMGYGSWERGLSLGVAELYSFEDFRTSVKHLHTAFTRDLSAEEAERLQLLALSHQHAEMVFLALESQAGIDESPGSLMRSVSFCRKLREFRRLSGVELGGCVPQLAAQEKALGDLVGAEIVPLFEKDVKPVERLPVRWRFRLDPDDAGLKADWQANPALKGDDWGEITVDRPWNAQEDVDAEARGRLQDYAGVAWYACSVYIGPHLREGDVYLNVLGVNARCRVFLGGKSAGEAGGDAPEAPASFRIPLKQVLPPDDGEQILMVRVEDRAGDVRGIWRPPWLSVAKRAGTDEKKPVEKDAAPAPQSAPAE